MTVIHYTPNGGKIITDLTAAFTGQTAILVGGSPSLKEQPLQLLQQPGVLTMAMNNAALHFSPVLWCGVDRPECFEPRILMDPRLMKFGNLAHAPTQLDAKYRELKYWQFPNMYFLLLEDNVPWDELFAQRRGVPWYNNTLMTSIVTLYQLGVRRIILAGSDFGPASSGAMYAHQTSLSSLEAKWNLDLYTSLLLELRRMRPLFERVGLEFYDCSKYSKLEPTYKAITMEKAVELCLETFPGSPLPTSELPHCSKFATEPVQDRIARWPGYKLAQDLRAGPAQ